MSNTQHYKNSWTLRNFSRSHTSVVLLYDYIACLFIVDLVIDMKGINVSIVNTKPKATVLSLLQKF